MELFGRRIALNCSILVPGRTRLEQPAVAAGAGFDAVEFWWPFDGPEVDDDELAAFARALDRAGTELVAVNLFGGDLAAGDRGITSVPGAEKAFRAALGSALRLADLTGVRVLHSLYGNRVPGTDPAVQDDLGAANLAWAAGRAADAGIRLVVEPLSGIAAYPLRTCADVLAVLDRVGRPDVQLLADVYHLATNGDDPARVIEHHVDRIGHVQLADAPGRGAPGTGTLPLGAYVRRLTALGYRGAVALEHLPVPTR